MTTGVTDLLNAAAAQQRAGNGGAALRTFEAVLATDRHNPIALNALAVHALDTGDARHAAQLLTRAVAADAKAIPLWLNLAKAHRLLADFENERTSLNHALEIDQLDLTALIRMAELEQRLGEAKAAAAHWSGVLQLSQGMGQLSTEFQDICIKAQSFVDRFSRGLAETVDAGLAEVRNNIDGAARRRFDAAIDHALGRRRIYQNKCDGMFFPFLPADEFFDRKHFPWLSEIETRTDAIRKELDALLARGSVFSPYVTQAPGTPSNLWTTLDNSSDWDSRFLTKFGAQDHAARQLCPATASAMDALPLFDIPGRGPNVFFSLLRAGAHIPAHTGVSNTRAIVHLPLIVPDHCTFRVGGETRTWQVGHAFAFDDTIEHEARNDSDALRAVLIFDVWNPHLSAEERELLTTFFAIADAGA
jgi:aspartyl/asparaginyl beta-hydroxylase (cupin superfamily)